MQEPTMDPTERQDAPASRLATRGEFLVGVGAALMGAVAAGRSPAAEPAAAPAHRWKGRGDSKVKRWAVVTIGNLSRNRYWGEGDEKGVRSAICTCTLVAGDDFRLLVDPSLPDADQM